MRYLILGDAHGNLEALEAVLHAAEDGYEAILYLGDLIDYGPNPNEVVDRVAGLSDTVSLLGNHDLAALGGLNLRAFNTQARLSAEWTIQQLSTESRRFLKSLEPTHQGQGFFLAHASPRDPIWEYLEEPGQGPSNFAILPGSLGFVGHTHVPRVFEEANRHIEVWSPGDGDVIELNPSRKILNPGSVGQPRDGDPRAAFAIWDVDSRTVTFRRVTYDIGTTQHKIRDAGLSEALASRLELGR